MCQTFKILMIPVRPFHFGKKKKEKKKEENLNFIIKNGRYKRG